jgi:hypothetical protein
VTVVGQLDDPLTLQLLDSQGLATGIENPDLQTAAALTECGRHLGDLDPEVGRQVASKPHREVRLPEASGRQSTLLEGGIRHR